MLTPERCNGGIHRDVWQNVTWDHSSSLESINQSINQSIHPSIHPSIKFQSLAILYNKIGHLRGSGSGSGSCSCICLAISRHACSLLSHCRNTSPMVPVTYLLPASDFTKIRRG